MQWDEYGTGTHLESRTYAAVRDELLSHIQRETLGAAKELLTHIGVKFDDRIIEALLGLKQTLGRQRMVKKYHKYITSFQTNLQFWQVM